MGKTKTCSSSSSCSSSWRADDGGPALLAPPAPPLPLLLLLPARLQRSDWFVQRLEEEWGIAEEWMLLLLVQGNGAAGNLGAEGSSVRRKHGGGVQGIIPSLFCELHIPKEGQKSSLPDNYTCSFPRTGAAAAQGATPYSTVLEYTWCKSTSLIFRKSTCSQQQQQRQSPTAATDAVANSSSRSARSRSGGLQRWQ
ncbi:uncharacterized protein [Triticum aestivum]|uniref:uncharacterized protein isoform X6 n=1 Tax=Triticum aestivum TaxID=4565 RepID=UPI001D02C1C9|nr:uncharacterized protein LOC123132850 isoform X6 [Triticum aestivum]